MLGDELGEEPTLTLGDVLGALLVGELVFVFGTLPGLLAGALVL